MTKKPDPDQLNLWDSGDDDQWMNFKKAREVAQSLKLKSSNEWYKLIDTSNKLDTSNIPKNPNIAYRFQGWISWDDWLGIPEETEKKTKPPETIWDLPKPDNWLPYKQARGFAHQYGFEYKEQWKNLIKGTDDIDKMTLPKNIPANPDVIYRHTGWKNWDDWLVSPERNIEYLKHIAAREFVRCLLLADKERWQEYCNQKEPVHTKYKLSVPIYPDLEYQNKGWNGWDDWLGTTIDFKDYNTTRNYIRSLKLKSEKDWNAYCCGEYKKVSRKPKNIYAYPELAYKDAGWKSWNDWLGLP